MQDPAKFVSPPLPPPRHSIVRLFMLRIMTIVLLVIAIGGSSIISLYSLAKDAERSETVVLPRVIFANRLSVDAVTLADLSIALAGVATEGERRTLDDRISGRAVTMEENITRLEALGVEAGAITTVRRTRDELMDGAQALSGIAQEEIALRREAGVPQQRMAHLAARRQNLLLHQQNVASHLTTLISAVASDAEQAAEQQSRDANALANRMLWLLVSGTLIGLAAISWIYHAFRIRLIDRVLDLRLAMVAWQSGGHYPQPRLGDDEIGQLGGVLTELISTVEHRTAELELLASIDFLTGLPNRRHFHEAAELALQRCVRHQRPASVLMGDIDHFKRVNDSLGHAAGDAALRQTALIWRNGLRQIDLCGRIGGEEFVALLPETTLPEAQAVAERLRATVAHTPLFREDGSRFPLTISIGVAAIRPDETLDRALARADKALYKAKTTGRDRVCCLDRPE